MFSENMKKKIVFQLNVDDGWVQRSLCMYTNCIKQFQTQSYYNWHLHGTRPSSDFPDRQPSAKMISPKD